MSLAQIWPYILVLGIFSLICGISTCLWWSKRARWETCMGEIEEVISKKDSEGSICHYPVITGIHRSEKFRFEGDVSYRELEIGESVTVTYDPKTRRYFEWSGFMMFLTIIIPIVMGCVLCFIAWRGYQVSSDPNR